MSILQRNPRTYAATVIRGLLALGLGCSSSRGPLPHDGYIWQRTWNDDTRAGLSAAIPVFDGFRVNSAAVGPEGITVHTVDLAALAATRRPVRAVVRVEAGYPVDALRISALSAEWTRTWREAGVDLVGLEIDHDCPTSDLAEYAISLQNLRAALPPDLRLSITALPTWAQSPALDPVIAAVDEVVLQVHTLDDPRNRDPEHVLFDPDRARGWVQSYARVPHLWVAVPAYGLRLASGEELRVDPTEVADFLRGLDRRAVEGVVWFRVPTPGEKRAWPIAAIAAVKQGVVPRGAAEVRLVQAATGLYDVSLVNHGTMWVSRPKRIGFEGQCTVADALSGYEVRASAWVRVEDLPLDPGEPVALGWIRCEAPPTVDFE